jgi:hypothetical protein
MKMERILRKRRSSYSWIQSGIQLKGRYQDLTLFVCLFVLVFQSRVSLDSPVYLRTHSVDHASLESRNLPASASQVLGFKSMHHHRPNMMVFLSNAKNSTRECLKLINNFSKVVNGKINSNKSVTIPYSKDKQAEKEIREMTPFHNSHK